MIAYALLALSAASSWSPLRQLPVPERPRDPWVFRSVLDGRPRIVTMALSKEMYLAYDAQTCGMYKCWKGGVELKGAVYTTVHGDQPVSYGDSYTRGLEGDVWSAEVDGKPVPARARWQGYFFTNKRVNLLYEIHLQDGRHIGVQESTEYTSSELILNEKQLEEMVLIHGTPVLLRTWRTDAIPDGVSIVLHMRTDNDVLQRRIVFPELGLRNERIIEEPLAPGTALAQGEKPRAYTLSKLPLSSGTPSAYVWTFFEPLADVAPPSAEDAAAKKGAKSNAPAAPAKANGDAAKKGG